ncbi:MAG: hypothetical protein HDR50_02465 [Desulfovibrio sp.]|uniref:hypothetical protein n=1 Tax=Desulfovibrio sp. TaxID=885 RepID=UPI001A76F6F7|nr:hypothetical protein [Desulfovibrio sp.]MBD5416538.1 hypothetical protein [Desulfovibrio sp.]
MSNLTMTQAEEKTIDSQIEQMMDWAKTRSAEAEQLALDSARLMACTTDRVDRLKNQGFFKRCWNRFSGKAGEMERANTNDIIQMQKTAFRYVNMLQEQQLLMAHSLLSLKNNLISLAVKEEETRNLIGMLAQRTLERFENLENRVDQLEISTNLQGWLLGLEEREYDEKIPTEYMRLFRVINDFYNIKKDNWNYNDLMFMRKAIRTVGINPKQKISLNSFIDKLTDEIQSEGVGFEAYGQAITMFKPEGIENYSKYVVENISSPVFVSMHGLKTQYMDRLDIVEELQDEMNISAGEALKRLLRRSINNMNVNLDYEFPLAETAIEILGCLRLGERLSSKNIEEKEIKSNLENIDIKISSTPNAVERNDKHFDCAKVKNINLNNCSFLPFEAIEVRLGSRAEEIKNIIQFKGRYIAATATTIYSSENLHDWNKIHDFSTDAGISYWLSEAGGYLFTNQDWSTRVYYSEEGNKWNELNLQKKFRGENIYYDNVLHNGELFLFSGRSSIDYSYTKSGIIFDSKEETSFLAGIISFGRDFNDLRSFNFADEYDQYNIKNTLCIGKKFYILLRHDRYDESKLLSSQNCMEWEEIDDSRIGDEIHSISKFGDYLIIDSDKPYLLDTKNNNLSIFSGPNEDSSFSDYSYQEIKNSLAIYKGAYDSNMYITQDLKAWKNIEVPTFDSGKTLPIIINSEYLIFVSDDKIYCSKIEHK